MPPVKSRFGAVRNLCASKIYHCKLFEVAVALDRLRLGFGARKPDERFVEILHEAADHRARAKDVRAVTFDDVLQGRAPSS